MGNEDYRSTLGGAVAALRAAHRVLIITGAGISADSGLPTYRGIGGLYESDLTDDGIAIEDALSGPMMAARPEIAWKYIAQIASACRGKGHNAAHEAVAEIERRVPECCVLTQNIDGFHRRAGSRSLIEIHGNLDSLLCTGCGREREVRDFDGMSLPPHCSDCGAIERPRVVLFGEMLPEPALAALHDYLSRGVDLVISIGTTSVFQYIAGPVIDAARMGVATVEINPGESEVSSLVRYRLRRRAIEALPELLDGL